MGVYRMRPVIIEAFQVNAEDWDGVCEIAAWCGGDVVDVENFLAYDDNAVMAITTLEGIMYAEHADWIVKGVQGEFCLCKPEVFDAIAEPMVQL